MSKIIISDKCGFCMGVRHAFEMSLNLREQFPREKICCYGEIVHNKFALELLRQHNICIEKEIQSIQSKKYDITIIRAHGVPPQEENLLSENSKIVDLTCPNVKKVQKLASQLSIDGYFLIILGKEGHPEVKGICGYCKDFVIVKNLDNLLHCQIDLKTKEKIAFISQTTSNFFDFDQISNYLTDTFPNAKIVNTLCASPINIQQNAIELAKTVDLMLVIGDKTSSNTTTLYDLCSSHCETVFVETSEDINCLDINSYDVIGISAGSSTPQTQINSIVSYLQSLTNLNKYNIAFL